MLGTIEALWRYPVKSMQGEPVARSLVDDRGLLGDRGYAILDRETGLIASAKHPRKWASLIQCRAAFAAPPIADRPLPPLLITLPDGTMVDSAAANANRMLSEFFGRAVALINDAPPERLRESDRTPIDGDPEQPIIRRETMGAAAPDGTFFDYAALHMLTSASLLRLAELEPAGQFAVQRFRPNIVVRPVQPASGFVEVAWLGQQLRSGEVQLAVIDPSPRCVVTTLAQGELPRDPNILRTATRHSSAVSVTLAPGVVLGAVVGVYAAVLRPGELSCGDALALLTADH